jgi:prepilin peptidase CpaA
MNYELVWSLRLYVLLALILAIWSDSVRRKIPNELSLVLLLSGLLANAVVPGGTGLFHRDNPGGLGFVTAAVGALTLFIPLWLAWSKHWLGAGDVKLMVALGAWVGWRESFALLLLITACGGVLALVRVLTSRRRRIIAGTLVTNLQSMFFEFTAPGQTGARLDLRRESADRMPYAWAIFLGMLAYMVVAYKQL